MRQWHAESVSHPNASLNIKGQSITEQEAKEFATIIWSHMYKKINPSSKDQNKENWLLTKHPRGGMMWKMKASVAYVDMMLNIQDDCSSVTQLSFASIERNYIEHSV